jgi:hypothetical protein
MQNVAPVTKPTMKRSNAGGANGARRISVDANRTTEAGVFRARKKPVVIECIQWTGTNLRDVIAFTGRHPSAKDWSWEKFEAIVADQGLKIFTLEGSHLATIGDYIIKGVHGEFYPCKPDIFLKTYETDFSPEPAPEPIVYGVIVTSKEAKSGAKGNPVMTKEGERFWATVDPEGWVEASSSRVNVTGESPPGDPLIFKTRERAEEFAKRWKGHPWWCIPNGQYEIVPLVAKTVTDPRITGYERQPKTKVEK